MRPLELELTLHRFVSIAATALVIVAAAAQSLVAQPAPVPADTGGLTREAVAEEMKAVETSAALSDEQRATALDLYRQALEQFDKIDGERQRLGDFDERRRTIRNKEDLQRELASEDSPVAISPTASEQQLASDLAAAKENLERARAELGDFEREPARRAQRKAEIAKLMAETSSRLAEARGAMDAPAESNEPAEIRRSRAVLLAVLVPALEGKKAALEAELKYYDASDDLLALDRDLAQRRVERLSRVIEATSKARDAVRAADVQKLKQEASRLAREAVQSCVPALVELAARNEALVDQHAEITRRVSEADDRSDELVKVADDVHAERERLASKVATLGLTNTIGQLLRRQHGMLPDVRWHAAEVKRRQDESNEVTLAIEALRDERAELADVDQRVEDIVDGLPDEFAFSQLTAVETEARQVIRAVRNSQDQLIRDYDEYFSALVDLDSAENRVIAETQTFSVFIAEHILWVQSTTPLWQTDFRALASDVAWLAGPKNWIKLAGDAFRNTLANWLRSIVVVGGTIALILVRSRARRRIREAGEAVQRNYTFTFPQTLVALAWTTVLAAAWPSVLLLFGWLASSSSATGHFPEAIARGLNHTAVLLFLLEFARLVFRPSGLAGDHFRWRAGDLSVVRRSVFGLTCIGVPLVFVAMVCKHDRANDPGELLARLAYISVMLVVAYFMFRVVRPSSGAGQGWLAAIGRGWVRYSTLVAILAASVPISLIVVDLLGYHYTAMRMGNRLAATAGVLFGLLLLYATLLRWLFTARGKLARKLAMERKAQAASADGADAELAAAVPVEDEVDLAALDTQSRKLLRSAAVITMLVSTWLIWVDVLPALTFLDQDQFALWSLGHVGPQGQESFITVADILLGLGVLFLTYLAASNVPAFLEMALLEHVPIDAGGRYAVSSIVRYLIGVFGICMTANMAGISWQKVQWLVAAITVGLGFGLQEIFANFVSGLILLLERPIRVGDVVTVDNVSGVVSRIRMRATTITNGERQEFIVPNKEFVTGRLLNWTLSDKVTRISIPVSIATGTDTRRVRKLLLEIARNHPAVMEEPAPSATFEKFGNGSLDFVLRCFLAAVEDRGPTLNDLNTTIDETFRREGVEMASPQQDVNIRKITADLPLPPAAIATFGIDRPSASSGRDQRAA